MSSTENKDAKKTTAVALSTKGLEDALAFAKVMVSSKITPFNTPEQALVAITFGREIGMTPAVAIQNISVVNGKATLGIHAVSSRLINGGVQYEELYNGVPVPRYFLFYPTDEEQSTPLTEKGYLQLIDDGFPVKLCDFFGSKEQQKQQKKKYYDEFGKDHMLVGRKPDPSETKIVKTAIKFSRWVNVNNVPTLKTHTEVLYTSDLSAAVLAKDNWVNNFRVMLRTRCLMFGSRFFAPDLMSGVYDLTEMLESMDANFNVDDSGQVTNISDYGKIDPENVVINANAVEDVDPLTTEEK